MVPPDPDRANPPMMGHAAHAWPIIGMVRSPFTVASGTPIQPPYAAGATGEVILAAPYDQALDDIEGFERVRLYWLDTASTGRQPAVTASTGRSDGRNQPTTARQGAGS
jgi:tRNA (Thr-GGU) A37 N-methylase